VVKNLDRIILDRIILIWKCLCPAKNLQLTFFKNDFVKNDSVIFWNHKSIGLIRNQARIKA